MTRFFPYLLLFIIPLTVLSCQKAPADPRPEPAPKTAPTATVPTPAESAAATKENTLELMDAVTEEEKATIKAIFLEFKTAVLSYQGSKAASMIAAPSLQYYQNLLVAVKTANQHPEDYQIMEQRLSPTMRTTARLIQSRLSADFVETTTPEKLYEVAFNQGWIGYKTFSTASIDFFRPINKGSDRYIAANFYHAGTVKDDLVLQIGFIYADGQWKIDLVPIFVAIEDKVNDWAEKNSIDVEESIKKTVETTQGALTPENWSPFVEKKHGFSVKFPQSPLFAEDGDWYIFTSMHHLYGQFDVRLKYYAEQEPNPHREDALRKTEIMTFLHQVGASSPRCSPHNLKENYLVQCEYLVPKHEAQGRCVWIFTKDRMYQLFNQARTNQYDADAAATFFESFSFGNAT